MQNQSELTMIVLVDDAEHARSHLISWLQSHAAGHAHWVLVACAPRMTHRISKWVSHSSREHWRDKWAEKLLLQLMPLLRSKGQTVATEVAKGPVAQWVEDLQAQAGRCEVLDWRKPRNAEPAVQPEGGRVAWTWLSSLAALAALQECA